MNERLQGNQYYRDILRQAIEASPQLRVKTKEQVLDFKDKLEQYLAVVKEYDNISAADSGGDVMVIEEAHNRLDFLQAELESIGKEILKDIAIAKKTFE
ncbi:MAG: hypothetical protein K0S38_302 [Candidatus Paceibacter sp.]|jgi:hypothetical protein|nr:hypothetical protein [Candidatus Paceibacter sp.]